MLRKALLTVFILTSAHLLIAQETFIGEWKEHVPYREANSVDASDNVVYCASTLACVAYNINNNEVRRYTTITGLSDVGITFLQYNKRVEGLLLAYKNGNLDILQGERITNISSIKDDDENLQDRTIYNMRMREELAYLCTGFGIVVLDMDRKEIKDTYFIGQNSDKIRVNDVYISEGENRIYAATESGVLIASLDDNLADYNSWSRLDFLPVPGGEYNHIDYFVDRYILSYVKDPDTNTVYFMQDTVVTVFDEANFSSNSDFRVDADRFIITKRNVVVDYDQNFQPQFTIFQYEGGRFSAPEMSIKKGDFFYIADRNAGLIKFRGERDYEEITPNGPTTASINEVDISKGVLWGTSGIMGPSYLSSGNIPDFNNYVSLEWTQGLNRTNEIALDSSYGFVSLKINPFNTNQVYSGSWDNGLIEILNGKVNTVYDFSTKAQTGHSLTPLENTELIRVGGVTIDDDQYLWVTTSGSSYALNVKDPDGNWTRFNLAQFVDPNTVIGDVIIDRTTGYKWIALNRRPHGILVYDDGGTPMSPFDDRATRLTSEVGGGDVPGSLLHTLVQDKSGSIWIGTDEGPAVFYNPSVVFESQLEAQRVLLEQDGQTQILLETENVRSLAVDGADRKWFGTLGSGAYLMSPDGTSEVSHFTAENSPLFSNEVNDITVNGENGEVFFCTTEGLISYKGTATEGDASFGTIEVFPNPVDRGYSGLIAIKGLAENSNVKITDVNGVLIYETVAQGGQATWDGYSIKGSKARNGVYLIFSTNADGSASEVTKLLYLNN